jgi:hypothetical protein
MSRRTFKIFSRTTVSSVYAPALSSLFQEPCFLLRMGMGRGSRKENEINQHPRLTELYHICSMSFYHQHAALASRRGVGFRALLSYLVLSTERGLREWEWASASCCQEIREARSSISNPRFVALETCFGTRASRHTLQIS